MSTTDPEMRHGHKSHSKGFEGYKAAIVAETESGVILATDVRAGNVHDREGAADLVAEAVERSGQELEEVLGDTAYGDLETRESIEALGAEVIAKAPPGTRKGMFDRTDFRVDSKRGVVRCPAGKRSIRSKALPETIPAGGTSSPARIAVRVRYAQSARRVVRRRACCRSPRKTEVLWRLRKQQKDEAVPKALPQEGRGRAPDRPIGSARSSASEILREGQDRIPDRLGGHGGQPDAGGDGLGDLCVRCLGLRAPRRDRVPRAPMGRCPARTSPDGPFSARLLGPPSPRSVPD